jgi:hypothetical protein
MRRNRGYGEKQKKEPINERVSEGKKFHPFPFWKASQGGG